MDLSVIIVSWNVHELLSRLLDSIFQFTKDIGYEVIVIDNNSKDVTPQKIREQFKTKINDGQLKIIDNNFNAGFARANNQGLAVARGKYVLFMNPDMELTENSFKKIYDFMEQNPRVGISSCRLLYGDRTIQPNVKNDPTFHSQLLILLKLHHFFSWLPSLKRYLAKEVDYSRENKVEQIMGAFIFTRKDIMDRIKGWDEDYWLWWEDIELCHSVRNLDFDIVYLPITEVIHFEGRSFAQTFGLNKQKRFNRGMLTYFRKHHSIAAYAVLLVLQPISWLLTLLTQLFKIKPRTQSVISYNIRK